MAAIAAALLRALRLPGAMEDDFASPLRRRRRVPPVRPQFPVKTKRVVVAAAPQTPRATDQKVAGTARQPWQMPRMWEPQQTAAAAADMPSSGGALSTVTPLQAQAYGPAAERVRASAADADGAALLPLDAQLQEVDGSAGMAIDETSGAEESSIAASTAAVQADDEAVSAGSAAPEFATSAHMLPENPAPPLAADAEGQGLTAGHEPDLGAENSASNDSAAPQLLTEDAKAAAVSRRDPLPSLPQQRWPLPRVWLSGRDPWGERPRVYGSQPYSMQPKTGAVSPPATLQMPAAGQPEFAQPMKDHDVSRSVSNGVSNRSTQGARAQGSAPDAARLYPYSPRGGGAAGSGAGPRRATISANAAAGLLDAQPPTMSQRTAPRPLASSNGPSPGAGNAARPATLPGAGDASSVSNAVSGPIHQRSSALSAALLAGAQPTARSATSEGSAEPTKSLEARPQLKARGARADRPVSDHSLLELGTAKSDGAASTPEDTKVSVSDEDSADPAVEGRHMPKGHGLRRDAPRHTQNSIRRSGVSARSAAIRRAFRLGSPVRSLVFENGAGDEKLCKACTSRSMP